MIWDSCEASLKNSQDTCKAMLKNVSSKIVAKQIMPKNASFRIVAKQNALDWNIIVDKWIDKQTDYTY